VPVGEQHGLARLAVTRDVVLDDPMSLALRRLTTRHPTTKVVVRDRARLAACGQAAMVA